MKISEKGISLIKEFEGCNLKAYKDSVGVWTIGYGITNSDKSVTGTTVKSGLKISRLTAELWLRKSLDQKYAPKVMKYDDKYHWNQNQFDALVSFAYNIGSIDQLTAHGTRDIDTIARKILSYNKAGGRVFAGLTRRRKAEYNLFCTPVSQAYPGTFPALPPRGYYQIGDGYTTLKDYPTQIKRVQALVNWVMGGSLKVDGKYGQKTSDEVKRMQKKFGLPMNGKFGSLCLAAAREYEK